MKVSKAIKKIVALGVGATMVGATILGATAAADLKNYPDFFLEDGTFDGVIVVRGEVDSLAAVDIASNMWYSKPATAGTVTVSGDAKQIGESGDVLELYEDIGTVSEVLTSTDLQGLKSFSISTDKGTTNVNQYIRFDPTNLSQADAESGEVQFDENDDDVVGDFLFWKDGDEVFEYELEFTDGLESDIVAAKLDDVEDKKLWILGKEFIIVDTAVDVTGNDDVTLELMGGAVRDVVNLDESKSYTVAGKEYDVSLSFIDADECKFIVNGETGDLLEDGETDKLSDGTNIGVSEVLYQDFAGGKQQCEFFLGADELELTDTNFNDDVFDDSGVEANEESIEDAKVKIRATTDSSNATLEISEISYRLESDGKGGDDAWLSATASGLRAHLDEPQGMMHSDWDITYKGLAPVAEEEIKFDLAGDDQYEIKFINKAGKAYSMPFVNTEGAFKFGDDDDSLWFYEGNLTSGNNTGAMSLNTTAADPFHIAEDDFFVVSDDDVTAADETTYSYVLRYDSIDTSENKMTFSDLSSGTYEVTYSTATATDAQNIGGLGDEVQRGDLIVGGKTYKVLLSEGNSTNITVDLNQDGTIEGYNDTGSAIASPIDRVGLVSQYGLVIDLVKIADINAPANLPVGTDFNATLLTDSDQFDSTQAVDEATNVSIEDAGTELDGDVLTVSNLEAAADMTDLEDADEERGMTKYGALLMQTEEEGTDEESEITIKYPNGQRNPLVYVELKGTTTSTSGGELARVTIPVTATKRVDEVTDVGAQNIISVGGPCANSVSAAAMYTKQGKSVPADCTEGFTPGEAVIALYDVDTKVAMVVAGYTGDDTRRAGKVLAQSNKYALSGKQVTVTGTTFEDISVTKVG